MPFKGMKNYRLFLKKKRSANRYKVVTIKQQQKPQTTKTNRKCKNPTFTLIAVVKFFFKSYWEKNLISEGKHFLNFTHFISKKNTPF